MNTELMVIVERIVRPIGCRRSTKLRMREELYDTLEQIYAEEVAKPSDGPAALTAAAERLGEPNELRREFQRSLSLSDRYSHWYERLLFPPVISLWVVLRTGLLNALIFGVPVMSAVEIVRFVRGTPDMRLFFLTLAALFGVMSGLSLLFGNWAVGREYRLVWHQALPKRAWQRLLTGAVLTGLSLSVAMSVLYWAGDVGPQWFAPWRLGLIGLAGCCGFIAIVLLIQHEQESVTHWEDLVLN